ncbi:hypothetical protein CPB84DRAFT_1853111 [Gymnopilus junonius]|uniref:Uncharacterized protein n=1 Tax=Gymnopilus junonius TaxID=109634 RepID=A0A9P5TFW8_GYMJU|nr:hypothetical protein CPB84DRAFT_1853111 [Gymnopilus junonius]
MAVITPETEDDPQIYLLDPFFYPCCPSTTPDPASSAARLIKGLQANELTTSFLATALPPFLLHTAATRPGHVDNVLQTLKLLSNTSSLPLVEDWDSHPNATFAETFSVTFPDDLNDAIRGPIEITEHHSYVAASLLGARARSMGMLTTPDIVGSVAEGLGFPDEVLFHYEGDIAEIAIIGACVQLLGGASSLVKDQPDRFAKNKILAALDRIQSKENDVLIKFTKDHLQKEPLVDLSSAEIVTNLKEKGWHFIVDV